MMKTKYILIVLLFVVVFHSCAPTNQMALKRSSYEDYYEEKPACVMIMPPMNKSTKVEAKQFFYVTLVQPLVEKGFYVVPPYMGIEMLKNESAYDAEDLYGRSLLAASTTWGVDAVLFTTIYDWKKVGTGAVMVDISYELRSTTSNKVLYKRRGDVTVYMTSNSGSILVNLAAIALKTAFTREISVAKSCNVIGLADLPYGAHSKLYLNDKDTPIGEDKFSIVVSQ
ncbi:DUF799 family lipoprotein [Prolixibacteraceae bacterium]|nr:DUF799 family lipoprotein [Prolixibacteraceae bacterium]